MSPPFSPDDDDEQEGDRRTASSRRTLPSEPPASTTFRDPSAVAGSGIPSSSAYEENILINPELLRNRRASSKKRAGSNGTSTRISSSNNNADDDEEEAENDEYSKLKRTTQMEQQPKINKVMVEIPLVLSRNTRTLTLAGDSDSDNNDNGESSSSWEGIPRLQLSQNTRFSLHSHVPPSTPDGRWTGSVSGNAKVNQLVGSTNGSAQVSYKINPKTHFLGGLDLLSTTTTTTTTTSTTNNNNNSQRRPCQLQLGVRYAESSTSSMHVSLQQQEKNTWGINLSTRDVMDPWILSSSFWWNPTKGQWRSALSVASMTTHRVRLSMGMKSPTSNHGGGNDIGTYSSSWSWLPLAMAQIHIDPKISSIRRAPVALQYQPGTGVWNLTAALHTTKPSTTKDSHQKAVASSSWQLGLLGGSTKSSKWSILLAWTYGDITLKVPILLSTTLAMSKKSSSLTEENKVVAMVTPLLVLAISGLAQEMVARLIWGNSVLTAAPSESSSSSDSSSIHPTSNAIRTTKAKEDAQSQQTLMKRQADNRRSAEQQKNGLVIQQATYQLEGEHGVSWDVTIPLQFWVSADASSLILAEGSKQHLLGFYPLSNQKNGGGSDGKSKSSSTSIMSTTSEESSPQHYSATQGNNHGVPWWKEYWTPTAKRSTKTADKNKTLKENLVPTLKVQYTYQGRPFEVAIRDDEGLRLPQRETKNVESKN